MRIIFLGTSEFSTIVLEKLVESGMKPVLVITVPDKPVGRKQILVSPPVKLTAQKYGIEVLQPEESIQHTKYQILNTAPDLIVVAAYGQILPKEILDIPKYGVLNVHPSVLPKYRGPSPVQTAILNGDEKTGVTIMLMDEKVDHGPVLAAQEFSIFNFQFSNGKPTTPELKKKLAEVGAQLLVEVIPQWIDGNIRPRLQDDSKATYTKIIRKEDGRIDWTKNAEYIERQVRAFQPWPGTYTFYNHTLVKILKSGIVLTSGGVSPIPGTVFFSSEKKIAVVAGKDALLVEKLQLEGGNPMPSREFLLGHRNFIGTTLQ
ncbi:MAG: methionyl-tRNA formyltransferase [Candidatus Wildermuthbacteria bacterium]|nr:methionyl-tRNA formyltransferase [Candidatus Wildermuthbacteria bacterium]